MPPSPAYPDTARTTITFRLPNSDVAQNVLHWELADGAVVNQAFHDSLQTQLWTAWTANLAPLQHQSVVLASIKTQDLRTVPYPTFETLFTNTGSLTDNPMPWQMSVVASLHTVHAGRRGRGRVYLPGFTEANNTSTATVSTTLVAAVEDWATDVRDITTVDSQDVLWAVLSRSDALPYAVTSISCDTRWDVQRRRANRRIS